jgi:NAD(P) transhydrogenase subunit alpha
MKEGAIELDFEDEVIAGAAVTHAGEIKHAPTAEALSGEELTS